ncbi:hypothetical protein [Neisseria elongata]|uniref:hypothetical protein n=1 Tax=Neisseria elongata TaxID=495 RepID=UPI001957B8B7|nr:hypothetical protein [Neisseria elongata]MBM7065656.1 hypothetical protein [Neisseria elongata]
MKRSVRSEARIIGQGRLKTKHPQRGVVRGGQGCRTLCAGGVFRRPVSIPAMQQV